MAGREVIERAKLIPKWEIRLKKEANIHSAHSSTRIEGNRLTLDQVKALSEHKEVVASTKDKQEVLNYLEALDKIEQYAKKKLNSGLLLTIHKVLSKGTLKKEEFCGAYRDRQVFVGKRIFEGTQIKEVVEYMPPETEAVPRLVEEFFNWLNSEQIKDINPVILAGIVHYEIARIHPFIDGNGRTARLLATVLLYRSGFDHRRFFALDDYYDDNRSAYYDALKTVTDNNGDITQWLEYFTGGVLYSINQVKETVEKLSFAGEVNVSEQIALTPRQIKILGLIKEKGKIANKELRAEFKISRQAMLKEIDKLTEANLMILVGRGRGAYYRLVESGREKAKSENYQ